MSMQKKCVAPSEIETGEIIGGFAHAQVLALADKVVEAVKSGAIKKFVVMAGCDGRAKSRDYYTELLRLCRRTLSSLLPVVQNINITSCL